MGVTWLCFWGEGDVGDLNVGFRWVCGVEVKRHGCLLEKENVKVFYILHVVLLLALRFNAYSAIFNVVLDDSAGFKVRR